MKIKNIIIITLVWISSNYYSYAQNDLQPFSTFKVGINVLKDYNYGNFQHHWEPKIGGEIYLTSNFYSGYLQTGIVYNSFTSYLTGAPDFASYQFYLQWEYKVKLLLSLQGSIAGRVGMTEMSFEENNIVTDENLLSETELTVGPVVKFELPIYAGWSINFSGCYLTTFTYPRMYSLFLGGGISKSFNTPSWLKELLQ